ncbi:MAG: magnesium transporter [Myxococcales bacterium]|nr:magnesium transporter [Myxococcales bacterium]
MLGTLLKPDLEELIHAKEWDALREVLTEFDAPDRAELIEHCEVQEAALVFRILPRDTAGETFEYLPLEMQTRLVETLGDEQLKRVLDEMAPDDRTRLLEELPGEVTRRLVATLSPDQRKIASALLGYPERTAGRAMTPEYVTIRPEMSVTEAIEQIRVQAKNSETISVVYVVDQRGRLLDDLRLSTLVLAEPGAKVADLEDRQLVSILATATNEEVVAIFEKYDRVALPVTDTRGQLLGIITIDDVLDVQSEEATEDIQKLGGTEALDAPYLDVTFGEMIRKRGGWLAVLFLGEMLTATAMQYYEHQIERAVVLALFVPLIISSGGNSGSQATSIMIRALALRDVELGEWSRVLRREVMVGLTLGAILGAIGFLRIVLWPHHTTVYGPHFVMIAGAVAISLVGVVLFGTLTGSMLPFLLRRLRLDPATASAPFVATLVDVTGLVIYFSVASAMLRGILL